MHHYTHNYKILDKDSLKVTYHSIMPEANSACFAHVTSEVDLSNSYIDVYCFKQLELLSGWVKMVNNLFKLKAYISVSSGVDLHIPRETRWDERNTAKKVEVPYTIVRLDCAKAQTKEVVLMYLILLRPFCTVTEKQGIPEAYFKLRKELPKYLNNFICLYFAGLVGKNGSFAEISGHWIFHYDVQSLHKVSKIKENLLNGSPLDTRKKLQIYELTGNCKLAPEKIKEVYTVLDVDDGPSYTVSAAYTTKVKEIIAKKEFKKLKQIIND